MVVMEAGSCISLAGVAWLVCYSEGWDIRFSAMLRYCRLLLKFVLRVWLGDMYLIVLRPLGSYSLLLNFAGVAQAGTPPLLLAVLAT